MELDVSRPPCHGSSDPFILILTQTETLQLVDRQLSPISSERVDLFPARVGGVCHTAEPCCLTLNAIKTHLLFFFNLPYGSRGGNKGRDATPTR